MLANFTVTQGVNLRLQDSTRDMSLLQIRIFSSPVWTNLEVSERRSCPFFATDETGLQNWEVLLNRSSEKDWLFQNSWVLWTLPHIVWSNLLFLSLLFLSRGTTRSNWRIQSTWNKKEGKKMSIQHQSIKEKGYCCRMVGMWSVETLEN